MSALMAWTIVAGALTAATVVIVWIEDRAGRAVDAAREDAKAAYKRGYDDANRSAQSVVAARLGIVNGLGPLLTIVNSELEDKRQLIAGASEPGASQGARQGPRVHRGGWIKPVSPPDPASRPPGLPPVESQQVWDDKDLYREAKRQDPWPGTYTG